MILDAAINLLGGGVLRLAPEVLKIIDKKGERSHELAMVDKTYALDKLHADNGLALAQAQAAAARDSGETNMVIAALEAQARPSGVSWIDGLSTFVRPFLTLYWCVFMYSVALWAQFMFLKHHNLATVDIVLKLWGEDERSIVFGMIGFWFADRSIRRGRGVVK